MASTASGLLSSMPTMARVAPDAFMAKRMPSTICAAFSTIRRWSLVRYGSHSLPLTITVSGFFSALEVLSLTAVGNAAPPRPTMPQLAAMPTMSMSESASTFSRGRTDSSQRSSKSFSITTAGTVLPLATVQVVMATTLPDTDACTGAETKPCASPIT